MPTRWLPLCRHARHPLSSSSIPCVPVPGKRFPGTASPSSSSGSSANASRVPPSEQAYGISSPGPSLGCLGPGRRTVPKAGHFFSPPSFRGGRGAGPSPSPLRRFQKKFSPRCTGTCKKGGSSVPFSEGFFSGRETLRRRPASAGRGPAGRACRLRRDGSRSRPRRPSR